MPTKKSVLAVLGWLGNKNSDSGKYELDTPTIESIYDHIATKGLKELKIKELNLITATEELSNGKVAALLAKQFNSPLMIKPINWGAFEDKSKAAAARNTAVLEEATKVVLLKKGGTFGGDSLLQAVSEKQVSVYVYDVESGEGFTCKSEEIKDKIKSTRGTTKTIDHVGISRFLLDNHYVSFDVETTGLGSDAEVVQIGAVEINSDFCFLDTLIRPKGTMSESASAVNGITDAMLVNAPTFEEMFPVINAIISRFGVLCYNAPFDTAQIRQEYERMNRRMPVLRFEDSLPLVTSALEESSLVDRDYP